MSKIGFISLGCSKNLVDTEIMIGLCQDKGHTIVNDPVNAEIIIINTCGFIDNAKEEAISTILDTSKFKKKGNLKKLIVTGCLVQRYKEEILNELPEVDAIIGVDDFPRIAEILNAEESIHISGNTAPYPEGLPRILTTPPYMAYLKIAEGCDNKCTYCAIPSIRGPYRSRKPEDILSEARLLYEKGVKELCVVAQDTTRYGTDLCDKTNLSELLTFLSDVGFPWIRLFYTYADRIDDSLLSVIRNHRNILPYFDIPIQHINNNVLRRMGRRDSRDSIRNLIKKIRKLLPDAILRTSLIVGFPGETDEDFSELCDFVKEGWFDRLGVFKFSPEEGTPAARLPDQLSNATKTERNNILMEIARDVSHKKCLNKIGTVQTVLTERFSDMFYEGRTIGDAPDIDGKVYFTSKEDIPQGVFVKVKILHAEEYDLIGECINECT